MNVTGHQRMGFSGGAAEVDGIAYPRRRIPTLQDGCGGKVIRESAGPIDSASRFWLATRFPSRDRQPVLHYSPAVMKTSRSLAIPLVISVILPLAVVAEEKPPPTPPPAAPPPAPAKLFPDAALEAAVRRNVFAKRENQEPLTEQDVQNISTIESRNAGIKDLTGLEKCTALALLDLAKNQVVSLAPIKGLARLQSLTLTGNQIGDLSPLAECKALQYIELTDNKVEDVKPLSGLTALNSLYLSGNAIKDASPVFACTKLWSLYLDGNQLTSLQGIGALRGLTTLSLRKNSISDLSPLEPLEQLNMLFLENNQVADLAPLHRMLKKDFEGRKRFAPFLRIWLNGNPLNEDSKKLVEELKQLGCRIEL
jgi:internalin A